MEPDSKSKYRIKNNELKRCTNSPRNFVVGMESLEPTTSLMRALMLLNIPCSRKKVCHLNVKTSQLANSLKEH